MQDHQVATIYLSDQSDYLILIRLDEALRRREMNDAVQSGHTVLQRLTHVLHTAN